MRWLNIEDEGMWQVWLLIAGYGHVWLMDSGMLEVGRLELEDMDQVPLIEGLAIGVLGDASIRSEVSKCTHTEACWCGVSILGNHQRTHSFLLKLEVSRRKGMNRAKRMRQERHMCTGDSE